MTTEEEVLIEIEAVEAVYGSDCHVIQKFPPHFNVHLKPRTADDISQQFVEAIIGIQADSQYPRVPPCIQIVDSKGLDEGRQNHLISILQDKVHELASYPLLVALCEEAVYALSSMNHPDGDCPLCLYPLVTEVGSSDFLPFMKLMSCFHCFHSECIIRWWRWLHEENETSCNNNIQNTEASVHNRSQRRSEMKNSLKNGISNCPVCRKPFHTKDIDHVLDIVGTDSPQVSLEGASTNDGDELEYLQSETENCRRQKYAAILKKQEENMGLIEPKRNDVLLPGVFLPHPVTALAASNTLIPAELQDDGQLRNSPSELNSSNPSSTPSTSRQNKARMQIKNSGYPRRQMSAQSTKKQWVKKEKITPE